MWVRYNLKQPLINHESPELLFEKEYTDIMDYEETAV